MVVRLVRPRPSCVVWVSGVVPGVPPRAASPGLTPVATQSTVPGSADRTVEGRRTRVPSLPTEPRPSCPWTWRTRTQWVLLDNTQGPPDKVGLVCVVGTDPHTTPEGRTQCASVVVARPGPLHRLGTRLPSLGRRPRRGWVHVSSVSFGYAGPSAADTSSSVWGAHRTDDVFDSGETGSRASFHRGGSVLVRDGPRRRVPGRR